MGFCLQLGFYVQYDVSQLSCNLLCTTLLYKKPGQSVLVYHIPRLSALSHVPPLGQRDSYPPNRAALARIHIHNVAEGGVLAILKALELVLGIIYPRVSISVTKTNDRARALALDLLDKFATAMAKLPPGTLTPAEMRAYIDREILTIPVTASDIVQDDARAGTAAENDADVFGADALASEADELLSWIIASLPEAELAALITEANQVAAALRLATRIEDLAGESATLAAWLNVTASPSFFYTAPQSTFAQWTTAHLGETWSQIKVDKMRRPCWEIDTNTAPP